MNIEAVLPLLSRWAHILAAMTLVGGTLFSRFALVPGVGESVAADEVREAIRKRWMKFVAGAALFLLVSGFYNLVLKAKGFDLPGLYLGLVAVKFFLALFAFWLSATLVGRSERAQKFRQRETHWLNILTAVVVVITLMAGVMKMDSATYQKKIKVKPELNAEGIKVTRLSESIDPRITRVH